MASCVAALGKRQQMMESAVGNSYKGKELPSTYRREKPFHSPALSASDASMSVASSSIPVPVFAEAEASAKHMKLSRSKLCAKALDAIVSEHADNDLTALANALAEMNEDADLALFRRARARNVLKNSEW